MTYTIKEVSALTGLSIPTLRYYDKEGFCLTCAGKNPDTVFFQMRISMCLS